MRTPGYLLLLYLGFPSVGWAQQPTAAETTAVGTAQAWQKLIDSGQIAEADTLCTSWVHSADLTEQVEAQKCLANVDLAHGAGSLRKGKSVGIDGEGYEPGTIDEALRHLDAGLRLAPQDVSLHEGRLHVLEVSGRYDEMVKALEDSVETYKGPGTPDIWLAYAAELSNQGHPQVGLQVSQVLAKYYPENSDVVGNVGSFLSQLGRWDQALPVLRRAVEMKPNDPINTWNLAWTFDHLGQLDEADKWMSRTLQLPEDPQSLTTLKCTYGNFLVTEMHQQAKGCEMVLANCAERDQQICKAQKSPALH